MEAEGKHYITVYVGARVREDKGQPQQPQVSWIIGSCPRRLRTNS